MVRRVLLAAFVLFAVAAAALRIPGLSARVVHGDEAIHFWKCNELWSTGHYEYDPHDFHGPTLYYLTLPVLWLSGASNWQELTPAHFRIVPAIVGTATLLLLPLLRDGLGRLGVVAAAGLMAFSPWLSFYSRYYIQETLLAFFGVASLVCVWRFVSSRRPAWLLAGGAGVGLMHATKETFVLSIGCAAAGMLIAAGPRRLLRIWRRSTRLKGWLLASLAAAALTSVAAFSNGFSRPTAMVDSLRTYLLYWDRAGGAGLHEHPWHYYLGSLLHVNYAGGPHWTQALTLVLAVAGGLLSLLDARRLPRFLALYAMLLTIAYSAIPYKTPWCAVQLLVPYSLLAGYALRRLALACAAHAAAQRILLALFALGLAHLAWQARLANFLYAGDDRNPCVYAHPNRGVVRLADWVARLAPLHAEREDLRIRVIASDPWPLPWYLRRYPRVGYWETPPDDCDAAIVIASQEAADAVAARLHGDYHHSHYGLRRDVALHVFVERELFDAFRQSAP